MSIILCLVPILLLNKDQDYTTVLYILPSATNVLQSEYILVKPSLVNFDQTCIYCHQCFAQFLILLLNRFKTTQHFYNIQLSAAYALQSEYILVIPSLVEYDKIGIYCHQCFAWFLILLLNKHLHNISEHSTISCQCVLN